MKRLALSILLSTALAGGYQAAQHSAADAVQAAPAAGPVASSKPENGAWGIDLTGMDPSVKPGDDFFKYVNGKWLERTQIAPDKLDAGGLMALQDKALDETKVILEAAAADTTAAKGSETQKIGDWYASYTGHRLAEVPGRLRRGRAGGS